VRPAVTKPVSSEDLKQVAGGLVVLSGFIAAVAVTGTLARAPRNHPWGFAIGVVLVLVAGALWLLASLSARNRLKWLAVAGVVIGVALVTVAIVRTYGESEKPAIRAEIAADGLLSATVTAGQLSSKKSVAVRVEGLDRKNEKNQEEWIAHNLYEARLGPNSDGVVEHEIKLPLAPGTYELVRVRATIGDDYAVCPPDRVEDSQPTAVQLGTGCLVLTLPRLAPAPRVSAKWLSPGGPRSVVHITVRSENTPHRVAVRVLASGRSGPLAAALLFPNAAGIVDETIEVSVQKRYRLICVLARWQPLQEKTLRWSCPPSYRPDQLKENADLSWVVLSRPSLGSATRPHRQ
jgi:hypothetical protein